MSLDKAEIKQATFHQVGVLIDDSLEQAKNDVHVAQGASVGLIQTVKKVEGLGVHIDKDLDEGKYESIGSLEVAKIAKMYLQRAVAVMRSDAMSFEQRRLMAQGRVTAFEQTVALTKKLHDIETRKIEAIRDAENEIANESSGSNGRDRRVYSDSRAIGIHPGMTIKQRRIAEERLTGETSSSPKKSKVRRLATDGSNS